MSALTHGEAEDVRDAFKRARERTDPDAGVEIFSEDAEYRGDPFEEPMRGENAIRAFWNESAATQIHVEFDAERIWVMGRTILASWHAAYTRRDNADRIRLRGFLTFEVDEQGKVWRAREWWHARTVGKDATVAPGAPRSG